LARCGFVNDCFAGATSNISYKFPVNELQECDGETRILARIPARQLTLFVLNRKGVQKSFMQETKEESKHGELL
jgi:hypothetical protein